MHDEMGSKHQRIMRRPRMVVVAAGVTFLIALGLLIHSELPACHTPTPGQSIRSAHRPGQGALAPAPAPWRRSTHLVLVAGHAVFTGASRSASSIRSEGSWHLETFQRGQLATMLQHIQRGVAIAASDNASLLVFSGGETRAAAGPRSEASSYWEAADALGWYGYPAVRSRSLLESHARDSFENLLFAMCRFREASGRYPSRVTVVSFGFKRRRFTEVRRRAMVGRVAPRIPAQAAILRASAPAASSSTTSPLLPLLAASHTARLSRAHLPSAVRSCTAPRCAFRAHASRTLASIRLASGSKSCVANSRAARSRLSAIHTGVRSSSSSASERTATPFVGTWATTRAALS